MLKNILTFILLTIPLTESNLQAGCGCGNNWAAFGAGVGVGIISTQIYNSNLPQNNCGCYPPCYGASNGCVIYSEPPPVIIQQPVIQQQVVYRSSYDLIGKSIVTQATSTPSARRLTLDNGMVFEIAPGTFNWTGHSVTIYRDAYAGTTGNYVLELRDQQYRANRLAGNTLAAPASGPIPAPPRPQ